MATNVLHIGVIEWASWSACSPTVIVADSEEALRRMAIERLKGTEVEDYPSFYEEFPVPDLDDAGAVKQWLDDFREATTAPWFTEYIHELGGNEVLD